MKVTLIIRTDSLVICDKVVEAPMTVGAVLDALREGTSALAHLRDLPFAAICIQARPFDHLPAAQPRNLNEEASGA